MKRKWTYILIGLLCFLGFSNEVSADYKEICVYKATHDAANQYKCSDVLTTIIILYDESNSTKPYKIKMERTCSDSGTNNTVLDSGDWLFDGKAQSNWRIVAKGYSYDGLSKNQCPNNVIFNKYNKDFICFYNNSNGQKWCANELDEDEKYYVTAPKMDTSLDKYDNIENPVCNRSKVLEGKDSSTNSTCYMKFEYDKTNDKLLIYRTTKDPSSNPNSFSLVGDNDTYFSCGSYTMGSGGNAVNVNKNVYLVNSNAGQFDKSVIITSRSEFNKKFLEEWNKTGSCPNFDIDGNGAKSGTDTADYYLLLPDAIADCQENGCSKVDVDGFGSLRDWNYNWSTWTEIKNTYNNCEGLLGDTLIELINDILLYIKILIPVALIAFGLTDFVKAVFSSKEEDMKKAQVKFIKRLIMAVVVFIVPSIINLLLNTIDGIWAHINNSACNIWK